MNDRDALVSFYVEAVGKNWVNKELWNSEERVGLWFGIGMDVAGHVQAITLEGNNLTGCLMDLDMWKYLSNLKQLLLTNNALKKHLPFHLFHHLRSLEVLNLSWNEIEGEIPEELYSLSELQLIKLDSNRLRGCISPNLGKLTKLRHINLSRNMLVGTVPDIGKNLFCLNKIDFSQNDLEGWVPYTAKEFLEGAPPPSPANGGL